MQLKHIGQMFMGALAGAIAFILVAGIIGGAGLGVTALLKACNTSSVSQANK